MPHATSGKHRPERPYGASLWMRWPEFGIYLDANGPMRHWRGQRDEREWPSALKRGGAWMWTVDDRVQTVTFARMVEHVREAGVFESNRALARDLRVDEITVRRAISANQRQWDDVVDDLKRRERW